MFLKLYFHYCISSISLTPYYVCNIKNSINAYFILHSIAPDLVIFKYYGLSVLVGHRSQFSGKSSPNATFPTASSRRHDLKNLILALGHELYPPHPCSASKTTDFADVDHVCQTFRNVRTLIALIVFKSVSTSLFHLFLGLPGLVFHQN